MNETAKNILQYGGPWLSAMGSISAVVVALVLARRRRVGKPVLTIWDQTSTMSVEELKSALVTEFLSFHIVNIGEAPVTITGLGWRVGFPWAQKYLLQEPPLRAPRDGYLRNDSLPKQLTTGQEAVIDLISLGEGDCCKALAMEYHGGPARLWARSARGLAFTADGRRISASLPRSLQATLVRIVRDKKG